MKYELKLKPFAEIKALKDSAIIMFFGLPVLANFEMRGDVKVDLYAGANRFYHVLLIILGFVLFLMNRFAKFAVSFINHSEAQKALENFDISDYGRTWTHYE